MRSSSSSHARSSGSLRADLLTAARFKAGYKVSLVDSVIAAVVHRQATLMHKDTEFEAVQEELDLSLALQETLISWHSL